MQQSEIIHRQRLFTASCMALVVTAMSFAVRGDIMPALTRQFHLTHEQMGLIAGPAFYGFTLAMIFGGPLCDVLGMGTLLAIALVGHAAGILITIFATGFKSLYAGTLLIGIANGMVEAFANPLIATMYPEKKIKMLSHFHAWCGRQSSKAPHCKRPKLRWLKPMKIYFPYKACFGRGLVWI